MVNSYVTQMPSVNWAPTELALPTQQLVALGQQLSAEWAKRDEQLEKIINLQSSIVPASAQEYFETLMKESFQPVIDKFGSDPDFIRTTEGRQMMSKALVSVPYQKVAALKQSHKNWEVSQPKIDSALQNGTLDPMQIDPRDEWKYDISKWNPNEHGPMWTPGSLHPHVQPDQYWLSVFKNLGENNGMFRYDESTGMFYFRQSNEVVDFETIVDTYLNNDVTADQYVNGWLNNYKRVIKQPLDKWDEIDRNDPGFKNWIRNKGLAVATGMPTSKMTPVAATHSALYGRSSGQSSKSTAGLPFNSLTDYQLLAFTTKENQVIESAIDRNEIKPTELEAYGSKKNRKKMLLDGETKAKFNEANLSYSTMREYLDGLKKLIMAEEDPSLQKKYAEQYAQAYHNLAYQLNNSLATTTKERGPIYENTRIQAPRSQILSLYNEGKEYKNAMTLKLDGDGTLDGDKIITEVNVVNHKIPKTNTIITNNAGNKVSIQNSSFMVGLTDEQQDFFKSRFSENGDELYKKIEAILLDYLDSNEVKFIKFGDRGGKDTSNMDPDPFKKNNFYIDKNLAFISRTQFRDKLKQLLKDESILDLYSGSQINEIMKLFMKEKDFSGKTTPHHILAHRGTVTYSPTRINDKDADGKSKNFGQNFGGQWWFGGTRGDDVLIFNFSMEVDPVANPNAWRLMNEEWMKGLSSEARTAYSQQYSSIGAGSDQNTDFLNALRLQLDPETYQMLYQLMFNEGLIR